jgi:hypothetical protein
MSDGRDGMGEHVEALIPVSCAFFWRYQTKVLLAHLVSKQSGIKL